MQKWFLDHPQSVGESYLEHFQTASRFSLTLVGAGMACLVHAILPRLFVDTGSKTVAALHARMKSRSSGPE